MTREEYERWCHDHRFGGFSAGYTSDNDTFASHLISVSIGPIQAYRGLTEAYAYHLSMCGGERVGDAYEARIERMSQDADYWRMYA